MNFGVSEIILRDSIRKAQVGSVFLIEYYRDTNILTIHYKITYVVTFNTCLNTN